MSGSARFARDERFGFCGRYRNATERDTSVIGCMSRARVLPPCRDHARAAGQQLIGRGWPKLGAAWGALWRVLNAASAEPGYQRHLRGGSLPRASWLHPLAFTPQP